MKRCPECRRDYSDDTLSFCLDDGERLVDGPSSDEPATAILSGRGAVVTASNESRTASLSNPENVAGPTTPGTARGKSAPAMILGAVLLAIGGIGYGFYQWVNKPKPEVSFQAAKITRLTTTGKASGVAISPDGKYVVHVQDDGGQLSLWTRQVATQSNVQIVAPAAAIEYSGLTFSPDGNFVYYSVSSQEFPRRALFQVPTLGGEPKKLFENLSAATITFSPDGKRFAFVRQAPGTESALMTANADGTNERKLLAHKNPPETIAAQAWSPDGKRIAYRVLNYDSNDSTVSEAQVDNGSTRQLTAQRWFRINRLVWMPDGSGLLMLATAGQSFVFQIWHLPYPGGAAYQLTNDLNNYPGMSLAEDSNTLAVVQSQTQASIWVAPTADSSRAQPVTSGSGKADFAPTWTPDGRIVYVSNAGGNTDILITGVGGGNPKQLTANTRLNNFPAVAPDGRYIAFQSDRTGVPHLWRMNIDGSDQRQLTNGEGGAQDPHFSPDGRLLLYRTILGRTIIWKIPADGIGEPTRLTEKISISPTISPDGKMVAYFSREDENAPWRIAITSLEGGEPLKTFDVLSNPVASPVLRWTPDGRSVAYIVTKDGVSNIFAQPIEGGAPKQLTDFKADRIFSFAYSRDGQQLALSRGTVSNDIVLISNFR